MAKYKIKRGLYLNPERVIVRANDDWYIGYQWVKVNRKFQYGYFIKYKDKENNRIWLHVDRPKYKTMHEMTLAVNAEIAGHVKSIMDQYKLKKADQEDMHKVVNPQLKMF